jgi:CBS domain-containing protein
MGDQQINQLTGQEKKDFLKSLLTDIEALERMISEQKIEAGVTRIGAEQEFCLVGKDMRPAMTGPEVLARVNEEHFTSELAKWNLEINLDPQEFEPGSFTAMHAQLDRLLELGRAKAEEEDSRIILTGILPTIRKSELDFKNMTPNPRYKVLDQSMKEQRGEDFTLNIEGVDELSLRHDSILFEACNTSFQIHLQVDPRRFADMYNWSQVISGPVLSACVNSPILLGKELWSETRIALFRQSIDIRHSGNYIRERQPRVAFGYKWLENNAAEIFKDDVSMYNLIISGEVEEDSMATLDEGGVPALRAMNLHNGTIYKWNRACYGVGGGVPHLRIENRYIPSGPTTVDEMAATVFWTGLMQAMPERCVGCWDEKLYFQDVRSNFLNAARNGLGTEFRWFGRTIDAARLIGDTLLPMAEEGLHASGMNEREYRPYLDVIHQRIRTRQTGSSWIIDSLRDLKRKHSADESLLILTKSMAEQAEEGAPVHTWERPKSSILVDIPAKYDRVDSIMSVNLITVREDDLLLFAENLMEWHDHTTLPVENRRGQVVGIISRLEVNDHREQKGEDEKALVKEWMQSDIVTIGPESSLEKATKAMQINDSGCLPVVKDGALVGIITKTDIRAVKERS